MGRARVRHFGRRRFLGLLGAGCAAAGAGAAWALYRAVRSAGSVGGDVNVVIFLIDTLRTDRMGCFGYSKPTCPNIDALAAEAVVFEQCNAPAPWTLPSVVSILTSTFPCEHNTLVDGQKIGPALEPLAARLKKIGYSTCSLLVNGYPGPMSGLNRGYDICEWVRATNRDGIRAVDGPTVGRWLDGLRGGPFHIYIHNVEPHNPYDAPDRLVGIFGSVPASIKQKVRQVSGAYRKLTRVDFQARRTVGTTDNTAEQQEQMAKLNELKGQISVLYDAAVWQADENLGSVVEALKRRGLWDNTLFAVIADHGEEFGEHGGWLHDQSVYEELMHVPLLIRFPKGRYAGRRVTEVVSLVDLMPTILDFLGRDELLGGLSGRSLMGCAAKGTSQSQGQFIVPGMRINLKKYYRPFKESRGDVNVVVRRGNWKGIFNAEPDSLELYDLSKDPAEQFDLSKPQAGRAEAMRSFAKGWLEACSSQGVPTAPVGLESLDEETTERLRSLGYVD